MCASSSATVHSEHGRGPVEVSRDQPLGELSAVEHGTAIEREDIELCHGRIVLRPPGSVEG